MLREWNGAERHARRLSHLTNAGLMLIQAQTRGWEDYWKLLEHLLRKLLKAGFIQNTEQYLSALCKSLTNALLFVALCASSIVLSPFL